MQRLIDSFAGAPFLASLVFTIVLILGGFSTVSAQSYICPRYVASCQGAKVGDTCVTTINPILGLSVNGVCHGENVDGSPLANGDCTDASGDHCTCLSNQTFTLPGGHDCAGKVDGDACTVGNLNKPGICSFSSVPTNTGQTCGDSNCFCLDNTVDPADLACPVYSLEQIASFAKSARAAGAGANPIQCTFYNVDLSSLCNPFFFPDLVIPDWVLANRKTDQGQDCLITYSDPVTFGFFQLGFELIDNVARGLTFFNGPLTGHYQNLTSAQMKSCQHIIDECVINDGDADTIPNCIDNCLTEANGDQADFDGDGVGDACDPDGPPGYFPHHPDCDCTLPDEVLPGEHMNHGQYVSCVAHGLKADGRQNDAKTKKAAALSECLMPVE